MGINLREAYLADDQFPTQAKLRLSSPISPTIAAFLLPLC